MPISWSLITVTYNSEATLRRFWTGAIPADVEWIVVDNNSTDASAEVAKQLGARVIQNDANLGFSAANNVGLAAASGTYIGFINPDVTVDFDDLPSVSDRIDDIGGLVSPQLINSDSTLQPNGRGLPLLLHKVLHRTAKEERLHGNYLVFAQPGEEKYVCWLIGAVVAGHADTFAALKGWDESFFLYYEDKDISLRSWRAGVPVALLGQFRWTHGWARETTGFRIKPWMRELASLARFYSRYPEFLLGGAPARNRNREACIRSGQAVERV